MQRIAMAWLNGFLNILIMLLWAIWALWEWRVFSEGDKVFLNSTRIVKISDHKSTRIMYDIEFKLNYDQQFVSALIKAPRYRRPTESFSIMRSEDMIEFNSVIPAEGYGADFVIASQEHLYNFNDCLIFSAKEWTCKSNDFLKLNIDDEKSEVDSPRVGMRDGEWIYNPYFGNVVKWRTSFLINKVMDGCSEGTCKTYHHANPSDYDLRDNIRAKMFSRQPNE